jgi:hypothetical protein
MTTILVTNLAAVSHHETPAKAARQAFRWLRRRVAAAVGRRRVLRRPSRPV